MVLAMKNIRKVLAITAGVVWVVGIIGSAVWSQWQMRRSLMVLAESEAAASFEKDIVYRRWVSMHGGVYVPPTEATPPNPYLSHLPERDITTTDGKTFTLVSPAYMTRQVHELGREQYGLRGHITSLNPLRPENGPDPWEAEALKAFERGVKEVESVEVLDGEPHLRVMRPLVVEQECLKCHGPEGYREGDIGGGISVSTPLSAHNAAFGDHRMLVVLAHAAIGILGLAGLWGGAGILKKSESRLRQSEERIRGIVEHSTSVFYACDAKGVPTYLSPQIETVLGYPPEEAMARWGDLMTDNPLNQIAEERAAAAFETGEAQPPYEIEAVHKAGHPVWLECRQSPVVKDGQVVGMAGSWRDISARKAGLAALRNREERLRLALEAAESATWDFDVPSDTMIYDRRWFRMLGYAAGEIKPDLRSWEALVHREDKSYVIGRFHAHLVGMTQIYETEHRLRHKSGDWIWVLDRGRVTERDSEGRPLRVCGTLMDITARKHAERMTQIQLDLIEFAADHSLDEVLKRALDEISTFVRSPTAFFALVAADQKSISLQEWSPSTTEICRVEAKQLHCTLDRAGVWADCVLAKNPVIHNDYQALPRKKGLPEGHPELVRELLVPVLRIESVVAILGVGNKPVPYTEEDAERVAALADVTWETIERKRVDERLRESEELQKAMIECSPLALYAFDLEGGVLSWNASAERLFGWSADEVVGKPLPTVPEEKAREFEAIRRRVAEGEVISGLEVVRRKKDGVRFDGRLSVAPIRDIDGELVGFMASMEDVTVWKEAEKERKELSEQLSQAQKLESVGRLAGGVAHDFNNMLSVILGHAEILLGKLEPGDRMAAGLREIQGAAERSALLTRQLLAFARKQVVEPKVLDLNETVEPLLKMLRRLIGEDIALLWHPGKNLWTILIDPSQVDQILANLCVNARDAIEDVGEIVIETRNVHLVAAQYDDHPEAVSGEYVLLSVSDDGCGVDKEALPYLFEPFFTTKEVGKGTGLGLPTVYGIVRQNGGWIDVQSESGKGAIFKIYLPRHCGEEMQPQEAVLDASLPRGSETILLVEDEPAALRMTARMLAGLGYRVLSASSPEEAIMLAHKHADEIDLLLTDVVMPGMNGKNLADKILSTHPGLVCLFMSGYTADVIAHHGMIHEGIAFIQKPFTMKDLAVKIRLLFDQD